MIKKARELVLNYFNDKRDITDPTLELEDVYVVWFCKTLQNWKALVSTNVRDGIYYEVTHDGDEDRTYIDVYKKWDNIIVKD